MKSILFTQAHHVSSYSKFLPFSIFVNYFSERALPSSHGGARRPCGMCQTPSAAQGSRRWRHAGLPDSVTCGGSLRPLQSHQTAPGQEGQPQCQGPGMIQNTPSLYRSSYWISSYLRNGIKWLMWAFSCDKCFMGFFYYGVMTEWIHSTAHSLQEEPS